MVVVMSKKETSPLQISEAQVLSSLLKSQQSILEKQEDAHQQLDKIQLNYKKSSAKVKQLQSAQSGHEELAETLELSKQELNESFDKLQAAKQKLSEFQQKPEKLRQQAINALLQEKRQDISGASEQGDKLMQEYSKLRSQKSQLASIRHALRPESELTKNEEAIEISQGLIVEAKAEIEKSEAALISLSTQQEEASNTQIAIQIIKYCDQNVLSIVEKHLKGEELSEQESGAIQSMFSDEASSSVPYAKEKVTSLDTTLTSKVFEQQLLKVIQDVQAQPEGQRPEFLSRLLSEAQELEQDAQKRQINALKEIEQNESSIELESSKIVRCKSDIVLAISDIGFTAEEFRNLRSTVEGEDLRKLQLEAVSLNAVLGMNDEQFEIARELINTAEELTEQERQILDFVALVQDESEINEKLEELLQANIAEQSKLIERGVEPVEATISEQIATNKFNLSKLDETYLEYSKELDQLSARDKGSFEEALSKDQLSALEKEKSILKKAQQEATSEYYAQSEEHESLRENIQKSHLKLREDLRVEELQKESLGNKIDSIYAELIGLEQESNKIAQSIKIQTRTIKGLESTAEVQAEPIIDVPLSIKQQIAHNKKMSALTAAFEARLAKASPELVEQQQSELEKQANILKQQQEEIARLRSSVNELDMELQNKESSQEQSWGPSLAEQMEEVSIVEALKGELQEKVAELESLRVKQQESETLHKQEVASLGEELESARREAEGLKGQIKESTVELDSLKLANAEAREKSQSQLGSLQEELAEARSSGSSKVTGLEEQLQQLKAKNAEMLEQHSTSEQEAQSALQELRAEHELASEQAKQAAVEMERTHNERVSALELQVRSAKESEASVKSELERTQSSLDQLGLEKDSLAEGLEKAKASLESSGGSNKELEAEIALLQKNIEANQASIASLKQEQESQEALHQAAVAQVKAIHLAELQELQSLLIVAKGVQEETVRQLESSKLQTVDLTKEKSALAKELALAKAQLLQKNQQGGAVNKELETRVKHLTELARKNTEELEKLKQQKLIQKQDLTKADQSVAEVEKRLKISQQTGNIGAIKKPIVQEKIADKVATISDDQILNDFRELRKIQRDTIHGILTDIPYGIEAFHDYAAKNGNELGERMPHDTESAKLLAEKEREKYKEIHNKYAYEDIEWNDRNQASITKDGVEICKLGNQKTTGERQEYNLNGKTISNYRSLDLPLDTEKGPMHMSLAVKDLQGKNVSEKEAVYLTAHYDKKGKLIEMTAPVPVYYTGKDKSSPVCIKQNGKIYTLPVNRGKYEEMMKEIAQNKGLNKGKEAHKLQGTEQSVDHISTAKIIGKNITVASALASKKPVVVKTGFKGQTSNTR